MHTHEVGTLDPSPADRPVGLDDAAVVELRQYTLHAGRRDELIGLFEAELVEPQEASGICIGGLYRDEGDPDRFVWQRGFRNMVDRERSLAEFYGGPVWAAHRSVANATMVDSDDVLLLRPTRPAHTARWGTTDRADAAAAVCVGILTYRPEYRLERRLSTVGHETLEAALGVTVTTWRTEPAENTFPTLPVRRTHAFVWQASFADAVRRERAVARLDADPAWRALVDGLGRRRTEQRLRLQPTARSRHPRPDDGTR